MEEEGGVVGGLCMGEAGVTEMLGEVVEGRHGGRCSDKNRCGEG